eukprot:7133731-Lingulodinium_polyedra.AAC.1
MSFPSGLGPGVPPPRRGPLIYLVPAPRVGVTFRGPCPPRGQSSGASAPAPVPSRQRPGAR